MVMFDARVGDKPFKCTDTYAGLGTTAAEVKISDFRLYVHDVTLHQKGGADVPVDLVQDGLWQYKNVALLDFEDKTGACSNGTAETNVSITGAAPAGTYDGLSFKVGIPFALNHADVASAPSPLNLSGLFWSWNSGYKFVRIDAAPTGFGPFLVHVGSTDCQGDFADGGVSACDRPNVAQVNLSGFDLDHNMVVVDYAALVAGSDLSKNVGGAPGCMSGPTDPECPAIFSRIGIDITDGSLHPDQQKLFRLE
jgi:uncharacterized repeat protein (TIGR04052 family)